MEWEGKGEEVRGVQKGWKERGRGKGKGGGGSMREGEGGGEGGE